MLDRRVEFEGEQDEAELLQHMCSLVARDRHYESAAIAAVQTGDTMRAICWAGKPPDLQNTSVQAALREVRAVATATSVAIPFDVAGEHLVFTASTEHLNAFDHREIDVLQELCAVFAQMLLGMRTRERRLRLERDRATHAEQRLSALWTITDRTLLSDYDAKLLARDILTEGREQLDLDIGYIGRVTAHGLHLEIISSQAGADGANTAHPFEQTEISLENTVAQEVVNAFETVTHLQAGHESLLVSATGESMVSKIEAFIGTPFTVGGEKHVLCFGAGTEREIPFTQQDRRYVELLASIFSRTLEQRETLRQIEYLQDHDPLTRLPHRNRFHARLSELLKSAKALDTIAVLIVDTDRFRQLVDEHGPDAGDEVVVELAQRLRLAKSAENELFRYRSDSFAIIAHGPAALTDVHFLAERCIAAISRPMRIDGSEARLTASIGISIFPSDGNDVSAISIAATTAMRRAKRAGPAQFRFYNELLDERFGRRRLFAEELREAVNKNEFVLYYQPIINLQSRDVIGAEALLRWHHPRRGIVGANEFIHVAEESDLINEIGVWVLHHAAAQAKAWSDAGMPLIVAINLSARQFGDAGLLADVETALKTSGVPPNLLEFEVTESIAMHDPDGAAYTLGCFRDLGLRVALDDFGTGHSSLAYLKRFPIDIIKLDQAFVAGLPEETADAAIANAVVALASSIKCEVRAEGIEMPVQEHYLRGIGVDSAQGFLIAPPLMPHAFERWLQTIHGNAAYKN